MSWPMALGVGWQAKTNGIEEKTVYIQYDVTLHSLQGVLIKRKFN